MEEQQAWRRRMKMALSILIVVSLFVSSRSRWCLEVLASDVTDKTRERVEREAERNNLVKEKETNQKDSEVEDTEGLTQEASHEITVKTVPVKELTPEEKIEEQAKNLPENAYLSVPNIYQNPELPTGCESVALTMGLSYMGYELDKTTIAGDYLIYSGTSMAEGYMGDPFSYGGAGIFPPGLVNTANDYLADQGATEQAHNLSGTAFRDLYPYVAAGHPVLIWTTMYYGYPMAQGIYAESDGYTYEWYTDEHCVVLGGYNQADNTVTLFDSLNGEMTIDADAMESIYDVIGQYAMTIY